MRPMTVERQGCSEGLEEICRVPSACCAFPLRVRDGRAAPCMARAASCAAPCRGRAASCAAPCMARAASCAAPCMARGASCAAILLLLLAQAAAVLAQPDSFYTSTPLLYFLYCFEQLMPKVTLFVGIVCAYRNRYRLQGMFDLLARAEQSLLERGVFWTVRVDYSLDASVLAFLVVVYVIQATEGVRAVAAYFKMLTYYVTVALLYMVFAQFRRMVSVICTGFRNTLDCLMDSVTTKRNKQYIIKQAENMAVNYHNLYLAARSLNKVYSMQLLLLILSSFLISTGQIYFLYLAFSMGQGFQKCLLRFLWLLSYSVISLLVVWPCTAIHKQAKEFNSYLYQMMINDETDEISNNRILRIHMALNREVVFTGCKFFNIDNGLVHSMIAASAAYLVIIIQFGETPFRDPTAQASNYTFYPNTTEIP